MKFLMPLKDGKNSKTLKVSVDGKSYDVQTSKDQDGRKFVEISAPPKNVMAHLVDLGWQFADERTAKQVSEETGIKLGPDGQPLLDVTAQKALAGK